VAVAAPCHPPDGSDRGGTRDSRWVHPSWIMPPTPALLVSRVLLERPRRWRSLLSRIWVPPPTPRRVSHPEVSFGAHSTKQRWGMVNMPPVILSTYSFAPCRCRCCGCIQILATNADPRALYRKLRAGRTRIISLLSSLKESLGTVKPAPQKVMYPVGRPGGRWGEEGVGVLFCNSRCCLLVACTRPHAFAPRTCIHRVHPLAHSYMTPCLTRDPPPPPPPPARFPPL